MATITFRSDAVTDAAIAELTPCDNPDIDRSAVIREAIQTAADAHRRAQLRQQAQRLAADPIDRAEIAEIHADLEPLRAW